MRNAHSIEAVKTDSRGDPLHECADSEADTFLILFDGVEVFRASTRALAAEWVSALEPGETGEYDPEDAAAGGDGKVYA